MTRDYAAVIVDVCRGGTVESRHQMAAVLVDEHGGQIARYGEADMVTFWRSAAKPFQAIPWVEDGTHDRWRWGAEELAIICASHAGSATHAGLVRRMLADIGLIEDDLLCDDTLKARHECSGNHAGILAACRFHGWDLPTYQHPQHPAQLAGLHAVAAASGVAAGDIPVGVDGCGIATYATPLAAAARAYARLPRLCPPVADAMRAHPLLVWGEGGLDTVVMQAFPGTVSKAGAEGLGCVTLPGGGGLVVKAVDGADRAVEPALVALLVRHLGLDEVPVAAAGLARPPVRNDRGDAVGELIARLPGR